jgi:hypothetical protein
MPENGFIDSSDPDSGVYSALVAQTRRSDNPPDSVEELTMADSIPPPAHNEAEEVRESLRPARIPSLNSLSLDADELAAIDSLGSYNQPTAHSEDDSPDSERIIMRDDMSAPVTAELGEKAQRALEAFQREDILAELKRNFGLTLPEGSYLPLHTLRNIHSIMNEQIWIADEQQLREAIMLIMNAIDANFGIKSRKIANDLNTLVEIFLERLEIRGFDREVLKLRANIPKSKSLPPPLPKN